MKCDISGFLKNLILFVFVMACFFYSTSLSHIYNRKIYPETNFTNRIVPKKSYSLQSNTQSINLSNRSIFYDNGKKIKLYCDHVVKDFYTDAEKVDHLLKKENITLTKLDLINVSLLHSIEVNDFIKINRVKYINYSQDELIPFETIYEKNALVADGIKVVWQPGETGTIRHYIREKYIDGILREKKELSQKKTKDPIKEIIAYGTGKFYGPYRRKFRMCASSYNPTVEQCDGDPFTTATGLRVRFGVVAVDPKVIKLGSRLWVSGYGYAIAADTGGLIKKMKIDLFFWRRLPNENWKGGYIDVYLLE